MPKRTGLNLDSYAVIDFETTGLSPAHGARPTEIALVMVSGGEIVDRYQSLMNPGVPIPHSIQAFTGITNSMVRNAPPIREVMREAVRFAGEHPIVAHNAAFDRKFWECETAAVHHGHGTSTFICSLLLARRLFPGAPNHKLATLVRALGLPSDGRFHRALADAECTAHLFIRLQQEVARVFGVRHCDCGLMLRMQAASRHRLEQCVRTYVAEV
ncbi:MAG: 3'-5' exonuclease [Wenzhouxiangellaceae bacterium]|nr:3'-5' exonuclease [Wenzhouxiangellaceae bacterium]